MDIEVLISELLSQKRFRVNIPEYVKGRLQQEFQDQSKMLARCDKYITLVKKRLRTEEKRLTRLGVTPGFMFDHVNDNTILLHSDPTLSLRPPLMDILKSLDWKQFEAVCGLVLEVNHVHDVSVTRKSYEGGVDVFGWLDTKHIETKDEKQKLFDRLVFRVYGQGTHSSRGGPISKSKVTLFISDLKEIRAHRGGSVEALPPKFALSSAPIVPVFITNGVLRKSSLELAKQNQIPTWQQEQVCDDLLSHSHIEYWLCSDKTYFDEDKFRSYLTSYLEKREFKP